MLLGIFWNLYLKHSIFCCFPPPPAMQMIYILMHRSICTFWISRENSLRLSYPSGKYSISVSLFFLFIFSRNLRNNLNKILKLLQTEHLFPLVTTIMSLPLKLKLMGKQLKKNIPVWIRPEIQPNQIFLVILLSATTAMEPLQSPPRSSVVMKASKRELLIWTYPSKPKMKKNSWMCKYQLKSVLSEIRVRAWVQVVFTSFFITGKTKVPY